MTYLAYDTESGTFTGETRRMTEAMKYEINTALLDCGASIRWIAAHCDQCDSANGVELVDGTALCYHCRREVGAA